MFFEVIYNCLVWLMRFYFKVRFGVCVDGVQHVPEAGGMIVAINHKSNYDPILVASFFPRHMKFLAKEELFSNGLNQWFLSGVGAYPYARGSGEVGVLKTIIKLLREGNVLTIFPEGTRNLSDVSQSKSGAVLFAIRAKVPIVPAAIAGDYRRGGKLKLVYGKPEYYEEYYDVKPSAEALHSLTMELMQEIYAMVEEANEVHSG